MDLSSLNSIAQSMVAPNKGILAADESTPTIENDLPQLIQNQLKAIDKSYRNLLLPAQMFQSI